MPNTWLPSNGIHRRLLNVALAALLAFTALVIIPSAVPAADAATKTFEYVLVFQNGTTVSGFSDGVKNTGFVPAVGGTEVPSVEDGMYIHMSCSDDFNLDLDPDDPLYGYSEADVGEQPTPGVDTAWRIADYAFRRVDTNGGQCGNLDLFEASIDIEKLTNDDQADSAPGPSITEGEEVNWTYIVTNTGNVDLTGVVVTDNMLDPTDITCPKTELAVEESMTCDATGIAVVGQYANMGTVTGDYDGGSVGDEDPSHYFGLPIPDPSMTLAKTTAEVVDEDGNGIDAGDTISYAFEVTNTGNVALHNITIEDHMAADGVVVSGGPIDLAVSASDSTTFTGAYTITQADINAGSFENCATAHGFDPDEGDVASNRSCTTDDFEKDPSMTLVKDGAWVDGDQDGYADVGEKIVYSFTVKNTGNVTLYDITLTDHMAPDVTVSGGPIDLAPGASDSSSFTGEYTITQADIDAGSFENCATAYGLDNQEAPVASNKSCTTDDLPDDPGIDLIKDGDWNDESGDGYAQVGETISYTFEVTNTGNVTLYNVDVSDLVGGVTVSGTPIPVLAPGETNVGNFTGSYTITQADIDAGHFYNIAEACGIDSDKTQVCDEDDHNEDLPQDPSIDVLKTVDKPEIEVTDTVEFLIKVTNDGNVTLHDVTLDDVMDWQKASGYTDGSTDVDACEALYTDEAMTSAYAGGALAVGDMLYAGCSVDLSYGDHGDGVRNTVDATGTAPDEETKVFDSDVALVDITRPPLGLAIEKKVGPLGTPLGSDLFVELYTTPAGYDGDVTWQVTIENLTGFPLEDLVFDDEKAAAAIAAFEAKIGGLNGDNVLIEDGKITFIFDGPIPDTTINTAGVEGVDKWGRSLPRVEDTAAVNQVAANSAIGDYVWNDVNGDGVQDADEKGIAGAKVILTLPDNTTVEGVTNANGLYLFSGLAAGTYKVELVLSSIPDPADGSNKITTVSSYTIDLADEETNLTADFGITATLPKTGVSADTLGAIALAMLLLGAAMLLATSRREDEIGEGGIAA